MSASFSQTFNPHINPIPLIPLILVVGITFHRRPTLNCLNLYVLFPPEAEQYSRRNCLIITGVKEKEGEDTDRVVLDIFEKKLNICLDIFQVDRSHRLNGPKRPESDNSQVIRPIIVKFATYRSRNLVFKAKKLLKGSGIAIFENLTTRRASLLKDVKRIEGNRNAWTMDGNILTFNMEGKIFTVRRIEDICKVRPNYF